MGLEEITNISAKNSGVIKELLERESILKARSRSNLESVKNEFTNNASAPMKYVVESRGLKTAYEGLGWDGSSFIAASAIGSNLIIRTENEIGRYVEQLNLFKTKYEAGLSI